MIIVCCLNKNFSPIRFIDCVQFSALIMVGMNLAKNWCAKLIFFKLVSNKNKEKCLFFN